jgi:hypothetical protein
MKFVSVILTFFWLILNYSEGNSQNYQYKIPTPKLVYTPISIQPDFKSVFDTVFPDMSFRWETDRSSMGDGMGSIQVIIHDSVCRLNGSLNIFLFEISKKTGKARIYSDEQLLKASIYLSYLQEEGRARYKFNIEKMTITRVDTIFTCYPDRPYYYDDPRFFNKYPRFNYRILVEFVQDKGYQFFPFKNEEWFFNITDHEIVSGVSQKLLNNGNTTKPMIWYQETIATMNLANHHGEGVIWNDGPKK